MFIPITCWLEAKPKLLNVFHVFDDDVHVHDAWLKTSSCSLNFFLIMASAQEKHREVLSSSRTTRAVHKLEQRHKRWFKEVVKHEGPAPHLDSPHAAEMSSLVMLSMHACFFLHVFPFRPAHHQEFFGIKYVGTH